MHQNVAGLSDLPLTIAEAPRVDIGPAPLTLTLAVSDPEIVMELRRLPEGVERDRFAAAALRVGVLSLRIANGNVDAGEIREAGQRLLCDVRELLSSRAADLAGQLGDTLGRYFDPAAGVVPQQMDRLLEKDGDLARVLSNHVGGDSSVLARTLADHLGEGSPIFRMLSPNETTGLQAQLRQVLQSALDEQKDKVLRQFSLDDKESALSRLSQLLHSNSEQIGKHLTLDDHGSSLSRLKRGLDDILEQLLRRQGEFHSEVRASIASLQARKQEAARSTRHGVSFEDQLGELLLRQTQRMGDVHDAVGARPGFVRASKKGDFVTVLSAESPAPGARITWEAKQKAGYTLAKALEEMSEARQNRQAQVGIFVFSAQFAPPELEPVARYGDDIVVVWDAEDPATDLHVRLAYSLARGLATRMRQVGDDQREALDELEQAVRNIERQIRYLTDFKKAGEGMQAKGAELATRADRMRRELEKQIETMDEQLAALRASEDGDGA